MWLYCNGDQFNGFISLFETPTEAYNKIRKMSQNSELSGASGSLKRVNYQSAFHFTSEICVNLFPNFYSLIFIQATIDQWFNKRTKVSNEKHQTENDTETEIETETQSVSVRENGKQKNIFSISYWLL